MLGRGWGRPVVVSWAVSAAPAFLSGTLPVSGPRLPLAGTAPGRSLRLWVAAFRYGKVAAAPARRNGPRTPPPGRKGRPNPAAAPAADPADRGPVSPPGRR